MYGCMGAWMYGCMGAQLCMAYGCMGVLNGSMDQLPRMNEWVHTQPTLTNIGSRMINAKTLVQ